MTKRETFTFVNDSRQVASSAEDAVLPSNLFRGREKKKKAYEGQFVWKRSMHGGCREKTHTISHALARAQTQKHRQGLAETLPTVFRLDLSPEAREQRHICLSYTEPVVFLTREVLISRGTPSPVLHSGVERRELKHSTLTYEIFSRQAEF